MFSAEGMDFILVVAQWKGDNSVKNWANGIFSDNTDRRGIFAAHLLNQDSDYETGIVKKNDNIFLTLSGHRGPPPDGREEYWITKSPDGSTQHNAMTDYQGGWVHKDKGATVRYYTFKPAENRICAFTWNTTHEVFETDEDSEFCMEYEMDSGAAGSSNTL